MKKRMLLAVMVFSCLISVSSVAFPATYSYYLPYFIGHTNHWTGVGLSNCSTSNTATVDVFVYDIDGNISENDTIEIAARGHEVFTIGNGLPNEGWIRINSTQPLVGLCFVATTGTDNYMADIPFASKLSPLLYIPHVGQGPVYDTCVMVCNPNATDTIVTLKFVDQQGNPLYTKSQTVNANGSWKYDLKNLLNSSTANYGSVEISASNGLAAFALYDNRKKGGYSYAGISAVDPADASGKYSYYLPYFIGHTNHWTGIGLSNCSTSGSATVEVFVYDSDGNISESDTMEIAARGHDVFTIGNGLPDEGWIRINSTQPLVGLCFVATTGTNNYMADIPFSSELSPLLYIPHVGQGPVYDTCVMVCNPNATDTIVTLKFVNQQGNPLYTKSQTVNANGSWKYDLKNLLNSSTANYGSVEISASNGLAAFALYDNRKKGGYSYAGISAVDPADASDTSGIIDNDGDGFTENQGDCDDDDNAIHLGATDVCGDGIDQDCDGNDEACEPEISYAFEDFNNGSEGFYEYDPFSFINDRYAFRGDGSYYYMFSTWNGGGNPSLNWYPRSQNSNYFDDFNISTVTYWNDGSAFVPYGLTVCTRKNLSGDPDYIEFDLVKDGYYAIYKAKGGSYEELVGFTPSFLPNIDGQANKLAIEKMDNSFRFFINDVEVEQLIIDGFSGGGLAVGSTGMVDVSFDDFKVTEPFEGQLVIPSPGYLDKLKELVYKVMTTTYLWYDTVPEVDIADYSSAEAFLEDLKYDELDKWSYITPKEEYDNLMEEGKYIGLGFGIKYGDNNEVWIKFVYEDSPAAAAGLSRGDKLIEINGRTIEEIETNNLWETAFGDNEVGTLVTLKIEDLAGLTRQLSLVKEWVTINTVLFDDVLNIDAKKIGYLVFNEFIGNSQEELDPVFTIFKLENVDELILDLRYNPGGRLNIAQYLSELIGGEQVEGGVFEALTFNDKYSTWDVVYDFSTTTALQSLDMDRVIVITTGDTCSASESVINGLRPYIDVVVIGDTTCGKPVGMIGYDLFDMHISPIEFKGLNADGDGEYFDGIEPTCHSEDDLTRQFGDTQENSLMKALNYLQTGSCTSGALTSGIMKVKGPRKEVPLSGFRREIGAF